MRLITLLVLLSTLCWAQTAVPAYELDHRIALSVARLTDPDARPAFTEEFLLADVALNPDDPRRFYNFSGDLSGRYIEVMSLLPEAERATIKLDELVAKVTAEQQEDGRFGDSSLHYTAAEIGGEHMALLWGNGRLLVGLMTYYEQTGNQAALSSARRLGDFFIGLAAQSRSPEIAERLKGFGAKGIICFTQYIEGLAMLARSTKDSKYIQAAKDAYTALPERGEVHTHGYLTTLRGVLMLHELTGDPNHLDYVRSTFDELLASKDYTRHGAVYEYFGGHGDRDEGCSSADFVRLAFHLYRLTDTESYLTVARAGLLNALFYNQYASGDFGHHFFTEGGMSASNPRRAWWCCTMHGLRALLAVRQDEVLVAKAGTTTLQLLVTQTYDQDGKAFRLEHAGEDDGTTHYRMTVTRWDDTPLLIAAPEETRIAKVNFNPVAGDVLDILVEYRVRFHTGDRGPAEHLPEAAATGYLTYGPYLMGFNEDHFVAEPDWGNQVSWTGLTAGELPLSLVVDYRHGGYPGIHPATLVPIGYQTYFGHPYLKVSTEFAASIVPKSPD